MIKSYFTFGCGQKHEGGYHVIEGEDPEANRKEMFRRFGTQWSFQYDGEKGEKVIVEHPAHKVEWDGITFEEAQQKLKQRINSMSSYKQMLCFWRYLPAGHAYFQGEVEALFCKVMEGKKQQLSYVEQVTVSKEVGWK